MENALGMKRFARVMATLNTVFGHGGPMTKKRVEVYYDVLRDYSINDIERGVARLLRTRTRQGMPTPAEIVEAIEGSVKDRATIAWGAVEKAIRSTGVYQGVKFSDPVVHTAIEMIGGWETLCGATTYDLCRLRVDFVRAYEVASRSEDQEHPDVVKGLLDGICGAPVEIAVPADTGQVSGYPKPPLRLAR